MKIASPQARSRARKSCGALLACLLALLIVAVVGETTSRIFAGWAFNTHHVCGWELYPSGWNYTATEHDPALGWRVQPSQYRNCYLNHEGRGWYYTTGPNGHRRGCDGEPQLVIVGDDAVFGSRVPDYATLPVLVEHLTERATLNAGVPGHGFDQTVLHAEQLAEAYPGATMVVVCTGEAVRLCGFAAYGGIKPWFDLKGDTLRLHNSPTPRIGDVAAWQWTIEHSYLVSSIIEADTGLDERVYMSRFYRAADNDARAVARALVARLAKLKTHRLIMVAVGADDLRREAEANHIETVAVMDGGGINTIARRIARTME